MSLLAEILVQLLSSLMGESLKNRVAAWKFRRSLGRVITKAVHEVLAGLAIDQSVRKTLAAQLGELLADMEASEVMGPDGSMVLRQTLWKRLCGLDVARAAESAALAPLRADWSPGWALINGLHREIVKGIDRHANGRGDLGDLGVSVRNAVRSRLDSKAQTECADFSGSRFGLRDSETFIARDEVLEELYSSCRLIGQAGILWIHGEPGVGKTQLACRLARRLDRTDGAAVPYLRLGVLDDDLRNRPLEELVSFCGVTGADRLNLDELHQTWKSIVRNRNIGAIVLDDVERVDQIWPFVPSDSDCIVIVVSRKNLTGVYAERFAVPPMPVDKVRDYARSLRGFAAELMLALSEDVSRMPALIPLIEAFREGGRVEELTELVPEPGGAGSSRFERLSVAAGRLALRKLDSDSVRCITILADLPCRRISARLLAVMVRDLGLESAAGVLDRLAAEGLLFRIPDGSFEVVDHVRAAVEAERQANRSRKGIKEAATAVIGFAAQVASIDREANERRIAVMAPEALVPDDPMDWIAGERENLLALVDRFGGRGDIDIDVGILELCSNISPILVRQGHTADAAALLRASIAIARKTGSVKDEAHLRLLLGALVHRRWDRYAEGIDELLRSLALYVKLGEVEGQASALRGIGQCERLRERYEQAHRFLHFARELFAMCGRREDEAECLLGIGLALVWCETPDPDWADAAFRNAEHLFRGEAAIGGVAEALWGRVEVERIEDNNEAAASLAWEALDLARQSGDVHLQAEIHLSQGRIALAEGEYAKAEEYFASALEMFRETLDKVASADVVLGIGEALAAQGDREGARSNWEEAHRLYIEVGNSGAARARALLEGAGIPVQKVNSSGPQRASTPTTERIS